MGEAARGAGGLYFEPRLESFQPVPQALAPSEDDWHDRDVHVVDQVGGEVSADRRGASADTHVEATGGLLSNLHGVGGVGVNEVEGRSAFHLYGGPRVMGEHEDRGMDRRVFSPPALPLFVSPRPTMRSELVPPHDLSTDAPVPVARVGIVDASAPTRIALALVEATEGPGGEEPFVEPGAGVSEWRFEALSLTGAEAVQGHREVVDPNK